MSDKIKNIVVSVVFIFIITFFFILSIITDDVELSYSERRNLAQLPQVSWDTVLDGTFAKKFNQYVVDQFPFREEFRNVKANIHFNLFRQKDNNDVYVVGDNILKIEYPFNENSIIRAAKKFNDLQDKYLKDANVYYSIVPDKNYFVAKKYGYPSIDYEKVVSIMNDNITDMEYIDIFDCLELEDYYKTDTHWSQDKIQDVVNKIATQMNFSDRLQNVVYEEKQIPNFYGVYYGQLALKGKPDTLKYLTNTTIQNASVLNYEDNTTTKVYNMDKLEAIDKYDVFLSGAVSLLKISNPNATTDKELIIFRDSFGSSIAPLFIDAYSTITLVDIRYINSNLLDQYIDFKDQDVLFLYSTLVLNNSVMLK